MSKEEPTNKTAPPSSEVANAKLCHIVKRPDFDGYGFNLHSEKSKPGQFIGKVDPKSPAEIAGLKEGDRILEVNGVSIGNETHKQVVQRIKSISCEVRLLLIDADGPKAKPDENGKENVANIKEEMIQQQEMNVNTQEMPGASANISSITMTTTKRISNASSSSAAAAAAAGATTASSSLDVTDRAITTSQNGEPKDSVHESNNSLYNNNNNNNSMKTPPPPSAAIATVGGGLQLPTTAAEMRAKLLSRKKYDPKNESVDLKKKFEIIQKL